MKTILKFVTSSYTWFTLYVIATVPALFISTQGERKWIILSLIWALNSLLSDILTQRAEKNLERWEGSGFYFTAEDMQRARQEGRLEEKLKKSN